MNQSAGADTVLKQPDKFIDLDTITVPPLLKKMVGLIRRPLEWFLAIDKINEIQAILNAKSKSENYFSDALSLLKVHPNISPSDRDKIPPKGALLVIANHPYGGLDGIILADTLLKRRPDVKILGNYLLQQIPQIRDRVIPVDPFGQSDSVRANISGIKQAVRWLKKGGALMVFPSGEVSHPIPGKWKISDPKWPAHIGALVRMARPKVLPIYFSGRNSLFFQAAGMVHPRLRTILLARELINKQNKTIEAYIGSPILFNRLKGFGNDRKLTDYLRFHTYFLKNRSKHFRPKIAPRASLLPFIKKNKPVADPVSTKLIKKDLVALGPKQRLAQQGDLAVYAARWKQAPHIIQEIGRLREITFREVGEGTGNPLDLDIFDTYYDHLFLWDRKAELIVGAYRLGECKKIIYRHGRKGLYTNSLFKFKNDFFERMDQAMELGRSFIRAEYQRKYGCLTLLWRGIGEAIVRKPDCRMLFGPVSISASYQYLSKNLIVELLKKKQADKRLARLVTARKPFRKRFAALSTNLSPCLDLEKFEDISMLISEIEKDGKGVPVLIKHYLKLDGKFIGFNVDKKFSDVVDGLVVVDLLKSDQKLLKRFMGAEGTAAFLSHYRSYKQKRAKSA